MKAYTLDEQLIYAVSIGDEAGAEILLQRGANVNAKRRDFDALLHYAIYLVDAKMVTLLLRHGADVNVPDHRSETPLHYAVTVNDEQIVMLLLNFGADANRSSVYGETPLHLAATHDATEHVLVHLLRNGGDADARNYEQWTPLHYALHKRKIGNARVLLDFGARVDHGAYNCVLRMVLDRNDVELARVMLERGAIATADGSKVNFKVVETNIVEYASRHKDDPVCQNLLLTNAFKLRALDLLTDADNFDAFVSEITSTGFDFAREALRMKGAPICEGYGVTVFDVLMDGLDRLSRYLNRARLRDAIRNYDYGRGFPMCASTIRYRVDEATSRWQLRSRGFGFVKTILGSRVALTGQYVDGVLGYFNDTELRMFAERVEEFGNRV